MKAIQCVEWGDPSKLVLADLPLPEPGSAQVRIRIAAAGVNFPDALIVQKKYQLQPKLPFVPGTEVAGTIDAVGTDVQHLKVGDRVIAFVGVGGFAEYVCAPAALAVPIPEGVSDEVAAAFTLTYATSHHALFDRGQLKAGETLLVLGAGGGVGLAAVELGKVAGARVIAAASSADKLAAAKEHGADELIDYAATDLRECGQGPDRGQRRRCHLRSGRRSRHRSRGALPRLARTAADCRLCTGRDSADPGESVTAERRIGGRVFWGEFAKREPKANFAMLKELFGWLKEGKLKPHVSQVYPLAETPRALDALLARNVIGKLVIRPQL